MAVQLNHTIVNCSDKARSAAFLTEVLGLPPPTTFGPFAVVEVANGVSLDFGDTDEPIRSQHYAFLVTEREFDEIFARIRDRGLGWWADPYKHREREVNANDGGRGLYFDDPDGHVLEIFTRPYGSGPLE